MRALGVTLVVCAAGIGAGAPAGARAGEAEERFTGVARGRDGAVLYREEHRVRRDGDRLLAATTTYRDAEGRDIAVLRTDFSRDPFAPSYVFEDLRTGALESVSVGDGRVEVRAGARARALAAPDPGGARRLVTGQGLDRYVQARLAAVAAGERLEVAYPIPGRLATYEMRIRALGTEGGVVRVRAEFSSWVLRLLAPALDVEYDAATRRLLRYRGLSNLDFAGENPDVEITYQHGPAASGRAEESRRASL